MNIYKRAVAQLVYFSGVGHLSRLFLKSSSGVILAYHRVCPLADQPAFLSGLFVEPHVFEEHMQYLKQRYHVITLEELIAHVIKKETPPKNSVVITFDDGYADNYQFAFPILKKLSLPATIFIPTAYIETGKSFGWDHLSVLVQHTTQQDITFEYDNKEFHYELSSYKDKARFFAHISEMLKFLDRAQEDEILSVIAEQLDVPFKENASSFVTWDQLREMQMHGISVGSHTHTHCAIACLNSSNVHQELYLSREILEGQLGKKVEFMAYPYGEQQHIADNTAMVKGAGYKAGLTTLPGFVSLEDDVFLLRRMCIGYNDPIEVFKLQLMGIWNHIMQVGRSWPSR